MKPTKICIEGLGDRSVGIAPEHAEVKMVIYDAEERLLIREALQEAFSTIWDMHVWVTFEDEIPTGPYP